ncbi:MULTISPECIES: DUF1700 domain-containing protein [unclassified Paenibacillus]|uniref:HAAS signaling domain-containing protein n=1 Tax=unclassified Paenibacillus TaxID=185978 RepID=UPI000955D731|nr:MULTISPECIES: DUF1700 domain-containing protein [unclassified Paenibacillus]ASS68042.1 DUF1700 domain-containing protein [Paenibacillus sp. RUD330]SIR40731.1 Uncharacterized membrane protein [Paenibacillus sp. RU4X]SIR50882.1 Uncharacterized membrane protein [Paenibacillus sp. RU4T]
MNREQYLQQLWNLLSPVPERTRKEWMYDYEEHFRMAAEHGRLEEEAASELGDPRLVAKELLLGYRVAEAESKGGSLPSVSRAVFAAVGIGFFNLVFVLGPYFGLLGVLFAFWAVSASLVVSVVPVLYEGWFGDALTGPQAISAAMVLLSLGLLSGAGTYKLTRSFMSLTLKYLQLNTRIMKGRKS